MKKVLVFLFEHGVSSSSTVRGFGQAEVIGFVKTDMGTTGAKGLKIEDTKMGIEESIEGTIKTYVHLLFLS